MILNRGLRFDICINADEEAYDYVKMASLLANIDNYLMVKDLLSNGTFIANQTLLKKSVPIYF